MIQLFCHNPMVFQFYSTASQIEEGCSPLAWEEKKYMRPWGVFTEHEIPPGRDPFASLSISQHGRQCLSCAHNPSGVFQVLSTPALCCQHLHLFVCQQPLRWRSLFCLQRHHKVLGNLCFCRGSTSPMTDRSGRINTLLVYPDRTPYLWSTMTSPAGWSQNYPVGL